MPAAIRDISRGRNAAMPGSKRRVTRIPELLLDHANCELKAASTALGFLYRYPDRAESCAAHVAAGA